MGGGRRADATVQLTARIRPYAVRSIRMTNSLPKGPAANVITHQIIRSATSIGANQREAQRARTKLEFASKTNLALQECDETGWLGISDAAEMLPSARLHALRSEQGAVVAVFSAITRTAKRGS